MAKLTTAQKRTLEAFLRYGEGYSTNPTTKVLARLGLIEWTGSIYVLTDTGRELAEQLFGKPDPEPPATFQLYFHDQRFAIPTLVAVGAMNDVLPTYREYVRKGEYVEIKSGEVMIVFPKLPFELPARNEPPADSEPVAEDSKPMPVIQWRKREDLLNGGFSNPQQSLYWYGEMNYLNREPLCDINGHALGSAQKARSGVKQGIQGKTPSNMAKGGKIAFIPQAQTPKRIARRRKQWLREMERNRNRNHHAAPVLKALGAVPEVVVTPTLQLVSRVQTPLASTVRRIA